LARGVPGAVASLRPLSPRRTGGPTPDERGSSRSERGEDAAGHLGGPTFGQPHLDRGYERLEEKLRGLGADIRRVKAE
jgi:hypothetical protein